MAFLSAAAGVLGSIGSFLASGTFLSSLVLGGIGIAAKYALAEMQDAPTQTVKLQVEYGAQVHRQVILGNVGVAGHHVFSHAYGDGNRQIMQIFRLSDWPIQAVSRIKRKERWDYLEPDGDGWWHPGFTRIKMRFHLGAMDQLADDFVVDKSDGRWTAEHRGAGISYAVVRNNLNADNLTAPWQPFFEAIGPLLYDWRLDSTVGGVGTNRFDNPSTWTGRSDNPVLQMYALERGFWRSGPNGPELIVGRGCGPEQLPLAQWTIAANICDEVVEGKYRYASNIIAESGPGVTHASNRQPLLEACAASWVRGAGGFYPIVGAPQAVVATITDANLRPAAGREISLRRETRSLVNFLAGSFTNPEKFYETDSLTQRSEAGAQVFDGERLPVNIPYTAVTDAAQGDRLLDIAYKSSRFEATANIWVDAKFGDIPLGRWIRWDSAKYGDRKYMIVGKRFGEPGENMLRDVYWVLQEVSELIYDPSATVTFPPVLLPQPTVVFYDELPNYNLYPVALTGNVTGRQLPAFQATWDLPESTSVVGVVFQYWPFGKPEDAKVSPEVPVSDQSFVISDGIVGSTDAQPSIYEIRYWLTRVPYRQPVPSEPIQRVAPQEVIGFNNDEIIEVLGENLKFIGEQQRKAWEAISTLGSQLTDATDTQTKFLIDMRSEYADGDSQTYAAAKDYIELQTGPDSALAKRVSLVEVGVTDVQTGLEATNSIVNLQEARITTTENGLVSQNTSITALQNKVNDPVTGNTALASVLSAHSTQITLINGELTAQADSILSVTAALGGNTSEALISFAASAGPSGYAATIRMLAKTAGTANRQSSLMVRVPSSTSARTETIVDAQRFIVGDFDAGGNLYAPLIFESGQITLDVAKIRTAVIDTFVTGAGKLTLGGPNESLRIII